MFLFRGASAALLSAILFGISTPLSKTFLDSMSPWLMAGLLYSGSGIGLALQRRIRNAPKARLSTSEKRWFSLAILTGGCIAPVLLLYGLAEMPASGAALLLNAESVMTAGIAWFVFKENVDRRIAIGLVFIIFGAIVLSWESNMQMGALWPSLAVLGACLCWAIDNNLTRKVSHQDATWIASTKGLVAGAVNIGLAILLGSKWPSVTDTVSTLILGLFAYGASLTLFVIALRDLGTARTGAYFSTAPFIGACLAVVMGEPITSPLIIAASLMGLGVLLHLTERHEHWHNHEPMAHTHYHEHDEHHQHEHEAPVASGTGHTHWHVHAPLRHRHPHYPDIHHQHQHESGH